MDRWEDEALVLSTLDYGDADRLVTLLTRSRGKLTAFAAGARKSRRRFAGALEPGTLLRARLVERHGSTVRLDAVDVLRAFARIREELPRIARALYALELCRELLRDAEPAPELLTLAVEWLDLLDAGEAGPTSVLSFELRALALAGSDAPLRGLRPLRRPSGTRPHLRCGPRRSGVRPLRAADPGRAGASRAAPGTGARSRPGSGPRSPAVRRAEAREILARFIEAQLGRRLRSVDFLRSVGVD